MLTCPASNMYAFDFKSLSPGVNQETVITFTYGYMHKHAYNMITLMNEEV